LVNALTVLLTTKNSMIIAAHCNCRNLKMPLKVI
jgi:hypothetical protein